MGRDAVNFKAKYTDKYTIPKKKRAEGRLGRIIQKSYRSCIKFLPVFWTKKTVTNKTFLCIVRSFEKI